MARLCKLPVSENYLSHLFHFGQTRDKTENFNFYTNVINSLKSIYNSVRSIESVSYTHLTFDFH